VGSPDFTSRVSADDCGIGFAWIGHKEVAWRFPLAFQIIFALIIVCSVMNLPESPRWLVMKGRHNDALEVLEDLNLKDRDDPWMQNEFKSIQATVEEMAKGSYRSLFDMSEYREFHRVCLAYVNQMFQQIGGINLITYYVSSYANHWLIGPLLIWFSRLPKFTRESVSCRVISRSCWPLATARST
jgi:hypothetical protein